MTEEPSVRDAVVALLANNSAVYLSTCTGDVPWGAGAFFAELDPFALTIVLESNGTTLRNVTNNPRAAVVIAPEGPFAPFLQGRADVVLRDETGKEQTIAALRAKAPEIEPLLAAPIEAVELHIEKWRVTDVANGWLPGKELSASMTTGSTNQ